MRIGRRGLLLAPLATPALASAQSGELVAGTWGGSYAALLAREIEQTLPGPRGLRPVHDVGTPAARKTRLIAERTARRASMDVVCLGEADTPAMGQLGLLEALTPQNVPNLAKVIPALRLPFTLPHICSVRAILSNPARTGPAPTHYDQLFAERFRNLLGFSDLLFTHMVESAALAAGGDDSSHRLGYAKALAAALKSAEVSATITWLGRAGMWKQAGIPVMARIPEEGATPYISCACVPKDARNKDAAFAHLNAMPDPGAALGFAQRMGFLPTTTDAELPPALQAEIGLTPEQQAKLRRQDFDDLARSNAETLDFWNREFKG